MKPKNYLIALFVRASIFIGFYSWYKGSAGAGNVLQFTLWMLTIVLVLGSISRIIKGSPTAVFLPKWWVYFSRVTYTAIVALLVWFGCPVLAAFFLAAWFLRYAADDMTKPVTSSS